ncbi:MAG: ABC transporter ATP-binding protein [Chitinophagia bacterium]|nr:ABC transporter ATP-binding protein [Chitinophagia bacterium]
MKHLRSLNFYFWKYRKRFFIGIFFVVASNYFAVLAPRITGLLVSKVQQQVTHSPNKPHSGEFTEQLLSPLLNGNLPFATIVTLCCLLILLAAVIRGILMFFMRQTIIVMSRHIEYDQKNEIYRHYQLLDTQFFKTHATGDLMNRITEDVSRVRMYTGPALMYLINLITLIGFCVYNMMSRDVNLSVMVLAPLPILAFTIYKVNSMINTRSEKIQGLLSDLTTHAQEAYSGIRVIKSFAQEKQTFDFFAAISESYKSAAIGLSKVEAIYFPSMALMIGISTLITILLGSYQSIGNPDSVGKLVEFVIYINLLTFPVSAIGWTASMIQRAAASQKRINEFLQIQPKVQSPDQPVSFPEIGVWEWKDVFFTYPHTGIAAIQGISFRVEPGEKILILGKTGSGKSTIAQLMMRMYDPDAGQITWNGVPLSRMSMKDLRSSIGYVQQDVILFSDTVAANISFGCENPPHSKVIEQAARFASIDNEISALAQGYDTMVGERGVTLSGGQKQRIAIARALVANPPCLLLDDCLSAVDTATEARIVDNLQQWMENKTVFFITHRIITALSFTKILVMEDGKIVQQGTHDQLLIQKGYYAELFRQQQETPDSAKEEGEGVFSE